MQTTNPWEVGSEFHWMNLNSFSAETVVPEGAILYSCGRSALIAILRYGSSRLGWKRLWIPDYYCDTVVGDILDSGSYTGMEFAFYSDNPIDQAAVPSVRSGDVMLVVNCFGVKTQDDYADMYKLGIPIIEDHSHDPWSQWARESTADYIVVSYRKTLPIPDGGALWSNTRAPLPAAPNPAAAQEIAEKLEAMLLKAMYLAGSVSEKDVFLSLFRVANHKLDEAAQQERPISVIAKSILSVFPWRQWREQRLKNIEFLHKQLRNLPAIELIGAKSKEGCLFSCVILLENREKRDRIKQIMMARSVYPAILWPLERTSCLWAGDRAIDLAGRMLSIHCDGRYNIEDMAKVATVLREGVDW